MRALRAAGSIRRPAAQHLVGIRAAQLSGSSRALAAPQASSASSETALGLLQLLQDKASPVKETTADQRVEGRVLSAAGGLVRVAMPGPVAVGCAVDLGGGALGVVQQYDRTGTLVALLAGEVPQTGDMVALKGTLSVRRTNVDSSKGVIFTSVVDLLEAEGQAGGVFQLPDMPPPHRRRPVGRYLPSGIAAVEALMPLGEGHRIGLVGPPGSGKSTAARFMMGSQSSDTACVYAAQKPLDRLQKQLAQCSNALTVIYADPARDTPCARYLVPICAMQVAKQLCTKHRHVLLVLDDLIGFADAAADLGRPPLGAPPVIAALLDFAGNVVDGGREHALTVAAVVDLEPEDGLPPIYRDLWRSAEQSLDVSVGFSAQLAVDGIMPAVDVDQLLAGGFAPTYQAPLFRQLRRELLRSLSKSRDLREKLEVGKQLGLHAEMDEEEELVSSRVARALLSHAAARTLPELAVLLTAALVYHFPQGKRRPSPTAIAGFQDAVIAAIRDNHPALWNTLCAAESLGEADASSALRNLGEALLLHRLEFRLTRPEF